MEHGRRRNPEFLTSTSQLRSPSSRPSGAPTPSCKLHVLNVSTSVSGRRRFSLRNFFPFPLACRPTSPMLLSGLCSAHDRPDPPISKAFPCREKHRLVLKLLNPSVCPHWLLSQVL